MHSCGDVNPFVPELIEIGVDALNPLEVKAGMNPVALKQKYGDKLVFHGGINAVLWSKPDEIRAEIERVVPVMKQGGRLHLRLRPLHPGQHQLGELQARARDAAPRGQLLRRGGAHGRGL